MANRADRRASAKIARQAVKRAKTPIEAAILRAAASFALEDVVAPLGSSMASTDFDDAWVRLTDDLHDILEERYPEFRTQVYAEAGSGVLAAARPDGDPAEMATRLFLCPVSGSFEDLSAFAGDAGRIAGLEASLREFGVVAEHNRCLMLPVLLPMAAFATDAASPGRVRALHDDLRDRLFDRMAGGAPSSSDHAGNALTALGGMESTAGGTGMAVAALAGIELMPFPPQGGAGSTEEELEAEDMARAAAIESWHDSYAADVARITIGAPLDWPACAAALAWETVRIPMEASLRRHGVPDGRPHVVHLATTDDGERLVVSAVAGPVAVGPFSVAADLAWFDADEFFARAEAGAEELVEHDGEAGVLAPLLGGA